MVSHFALLAAVCAAVVASSYGFGHQEHHKKIVIHVPYEKHEHHHTHTIYKHIKPKKEPVKHVEHKHKHVVEHKHKPVEHKHHHKSVDHKHKHAVEHKHKPIDHKHHHKHIDHKHHHKDIGHHHHHKDIGHHHDSKHIGHFHKHKHEEHKHGEEHQGFGESAIGSFESSPYSVHEDYDYSGTDAGDYTVFGGQAHGGESEESGEHESPVGHFEVLGHTYNPPSSGFASGFPQNSRTASLGQYLEKLNSKGESSSEHHGY